MELNFKEVTPDSGMSKQWYAKTDKGEYCIKKNNDRFYISVWCKRGRTVIESTKYLKTAMKRAQLWEDKHATV